MNLGLAYTDATEGLSGYDAQESAGITDAFENFR
jgi:hypothetical protein